MYITIPIATVLAACALQAAEPLQPASAILQKYIDVTGGTAAWEQVHSEIDMGRIAWPDKGLAGSFTRYLTAPDHELDSMDLQPAGRIDAGFENGIAWEKSAGRSGRIKKDEEREAAARDARFHAVARWTQFYSKEETLGVESIGGEDCFKVSMIPKSGEPEVEYFSKSTGLLVKTVIGSGENAEDAVTETYSGYKDFDGLKLPTLTTRQSSDEVITIAIAGVTWNEPIPTDYFTPPKDIR